MAISLRSTVAAPVAAYPALKASIVLFDCNPGTRSWTVPEGVSQIRAFVVGAGSGGSSSLAGGGGGYSEKLMNVTPGQVFSYTVGAGGSNGTSGGATSFGAAISATGGSTASGGIGSGGDVNTSGGAGHNESSGCGGAAGHAFGNGQAGTAAYGGGFSSGRVSRVDGWKIGVIPNDGASGGYGCGSMPSITSSQVLLRGWGGGGAQQNSDKSGGVGGGGAANTSGIGGPGLVGIEVIA